MSQFNSEEIMSKKLIALGILGLLGQTSFAANGWDPVAAGFYKEKTEVQTVFKYFENWKSIMTAPDCAFQVVDTKNVSKHALKGLHLGDICLMSADIRMQAMRSIETAMNSDLKKLKEAQKQSIADGKLADWQNELNQKHASMLKKGGGVGWMTEEINVAAEDKIAFEFSTFIPASRRAYVTWIKRTYCASADQTLNTDSKFFNSLVAEYGPVSQSINESQYRAQQYEMKIADATKLADKQEASAKTAEDKAAVKLLREEINLLGKIKDNDMKRPTGPNNQAIAHQWNFDTYAFAINRTGECDGHRPRYTLRLTIHGAKNPMLNDLTQSSIALVNKAKLTDSVKK
jgi:hypothetical protein